MKLAHFGTFDVENYGDLLFPLILDRRLADLCGCDAASWRTYGGCSVSWKI